MKKTLALVVTVGLLLTGCGSGTKKSSSLAAIPSGPCQASGTGTTDLSVKPVVAKPTAAAPTVTTVTDIVCGTGEEAKKGSKTVIKYLGVLYSDGTEFDSSWKRGKDQTFDFTLGAQQVIAGWDQGLVGMKVGGRRELVIPPALGYGPQGSPPVIPPNAPLIFVVDLVKLG